LKAIGPQIFGKIYKFKKRQYSLNQKSIVQGLRKKSEYRSQESEYIRKYLLLQLTAFNNFCYAIFVMPRNILRNFKSLK